jgi:hypothetical protein
MEYAKHGDFDRGDFCLGEILIGNFHRRIMSHIPCWWPSFYNGNASAPSATTYPHVHLSSPASTSRSLVQDAARRRQRNTDTSLESPQGLKFQNCCIFSHLITGDVYSSEFRSNVDVLPSSGILQESVHTKICFCDLSAELPLQS